MSIQRGESFYETSLSSAITAGQTTIGVVTAPNETSGYLVIEPKSTNREIIKYTGVTGTTLTGVSRGLAEYGSDDSAGTGKAHNAGATIANTDVHYYFSQYYNFLTGTSASGYNTMKIGDEGTCSATDRVWQVPLSSYTPFWGLSANGTMVVSEDGLTSYVISAGGSGLAAGDGIAITAGTINTDLLSSGGLRISAAQLGVYYDGSALKSTSAGELYLDKTVANDWTGANSFDGGVTFKDSCVFQSSGSYIFNGNTQVSALSCNQGIAVSGVASVSTLHFTDGSRQESLYTTYSYDASTTLGASSPDAVSCGQTSACIAKEIVLDWGGMGKGTLAVSANGTNSNDGYWTKVHLYKNDALHTTFQIHNTPGGTYSTVGLAKISANSGDKIQIYLQTENPANTASVSGFGLYWTKTPIITDYHVSFDDYNYQ